MRSCTKDLIGRRGELTVPRTDSAWALDECVRRNLIARCSQVSASMVVAHAVASVADRAIWSAICAFQGFQSRPRGAKRNHPAGIPSKAMLTNIQCMCSIFGLFFREGNKPAYSRDVCASPIRGIPRYAYVCAWTEFKSCGQLRCAASGPEPRNIDRLTVLQPKLYNVLSGPEWMIYRGASKPIPTPVSANAQQLLQFYKTSQAEAKSRIFGQGSGLAASERLKLGQGATAGVACPIPLMVLSHLVRVPAGWSGGEQVVRDCSEASEVLHC